jgi:hypothetical protein
MTRSQLIPLAASCLLVLTVALEAPAQLPGSFAPGTPPMQAGPTFSPYLNLLQRGNPAINYYGLVRPEMQFRSAIQNLSNELEQTQADTAVNGQSQNLTQTGHPIQFFNLSHYYPNGVQGTQGRAGGVGGLGARTGATGFPAGGMATQGIPTIGMQNTGMQNTGATNAPAGGRGSR